MAKNTKEIFLALLKYIDLVIELSIKKSCNYTNLLD